MVVVTSGLGGTFYVQGSGSNGPGLVKPMPLRDWLLASGNYKDHSSVSASKRMAAALLR